MTAKTFPEAMKLARSAGQDAGDRNARKHNRTAWSEDDWDVACEATNKVLAALGFVA